MKNKIFLSLLLLCFLNSLSKAQQTITTIINYETGWQGNLNHTTCNIFNISPFSIINGITHYPVSGGVLRSSSSPVVLKTKGDPQNRNNFVAGVAYAFSYPIKAGFTYNVSAEVFRVKNAGGTTLAQTNFEIGSTLNLPDPNQAGTNPTACGMVPYSKLIPIAAFRIGAVQINNSSAQTFNVIQNFTPTTNYSFFTILAYGDLIADEVNVNIKKITINETHPFSLSPNTIDIPCGNVVTQTFTVNNATNAPGVTNYTWNLGANNGWLFNNAPAPSTISTGTSNTLTLTPDCGKALSNVTATVTVGGINYNTNTAAISVSQPGYTISGASSICSGSSSYSVNGLVCNSTVVWTSPPSNLATLSSLATSSTTLTVTGNSGDFTLTANVTSCGVTTPVTLPVKVGGFTASDYTLTAGGSSTQPLLWCSGRTYSFAIGGPNPSNIAWTPPTGWTITYNGGSYCVMRAPAGSTPPSDAVTVTLNEPCGTQVTKTFQTAFSTSACTGTDPRFTFSPNPAPTFLNVSVASGFRTSGVTIRRIQVVRVATGLTVTDTNYTNGVLDATIVTSGYAPGSYTLRVFDGTIWAAYQFLK